MKKKILFIICILYILSIYGCAKQEVPKEPSIHVEVAQPNAVLTPKESECNQLGEKIIKECMDVNPKCFELKQQWDIRGCGQ